MLCVFATYTNLTLFLECITLSVPIYPTSNSVDLMYRRPKHSRSKPVPKSFTKPTIIKTPKRRNQTLRKSTKKGIHFDTVVIGAGIGGISAALGVTTPALAEQPTGKSLRSTTKHRRVLVIDKENDFCFHSTGRSAAIYSEAYGSPSVRALSVATKPFYYTPTKTGLLEPSEDATDNDLVNKRGAIWVATKSAQKDLEDLYAATRSLIPSFRVISLDEMRKMCPATAYPAAKEKMEYDDELAALYGKDDCDYVPTFACFEADAADMDVNGIWAAMAKVATINGAELVNNTALTRARYDSVKKWTLTLSNKTHDVGGQIVDDEVEITTDLVINAAGSWANETNAILGARQHHIQPKKRTIIQFQPEEYAKSTNSSSENGDALKNFNSWPSVFDMHDRYYFKPDAGRVLASPSEEVDVEAGDVQPDELTAAITIERIRQCSFFDPKNIVHQWAGLRSFAPDHEFVLGFDGGNPGSKFLTDNDQKGQHFGQDLLHVTGLGGYGIQSAMGNAVAISGLVHNGVFPREIIDMGLDPSAICPARF